MEYDITHLDKKKVIQALFAHAAPLNLGTVEYKIRKKMNDNVDGLSDEECEIILMKFYQMDKGSIQLLDYHKGKPMKLNFHKKGNGRVLVDSDGYDLRNGKYRFFEAFLNIFMLDEIFITKKGYRQFSLTGLPEHLIRSREQEEKFKFILKHTFIKENEFGKYFAIDDCKVKYTPTFML